MRPGVPLLAPKFQQPVRVVRLLLSVGMDPIWTHVRISLCALRIQIALENSNVSLHGNLLEDICVCKYHTSLFFQIQKEGKSLDTNLSPIVNSFHQGNASIDGCNLANREPLHQPIPNQVSILLNLVTLHFTRCQPDCVEGPESKCYCLAICSRFPCQNGGTCQPSVTDSRGFVCHCPPTHFGLFCEEEVMVAYLSVGAFIGIVLAIVSFISKSFCTSGWNTIFML